MYCRKCGTPNDDNAFKCVSCSAVIQDVGSTALAEGPVPNYMAQAILTTLFCCLPFGIAAIVYAAQVTPKLQAGDRVGALASSAKARQWSWVAFGLGLIVVLIYVLAAAAGGL